MANISIGQIIMDAQRLASRVKDLDALGNALLVEAEGNNRALETMRQFQDDIDSLNKLARNKTNSDMINRINQQNPSIREIRQENRELKASLEDHQRALELIMHKYREHTQHKVFQSRINFKEMYNEKLSEIIRKQSDKISEMAAVMQKAAIIDDDAVNKEIEWMHKLKIENQGLREILKIANEFGSANVSIPTNNVVFATHSNMISQIQPNLKSKLNNMDINNVSECDVLETATTLNLMQPNDIQIKTNSDCIGSASTSTSDEIKSIDSDSDSIITLTGSEPNEIHNLLVEPISMSTENDVEDDDDDDCKMNVEIVLKPDVDLYKTIKKGKTLHNGKNLKNFRDEKKPDLNQNEENYKEKKKNTEKLQENQKIQLDKNISEKLEKSPEKVIKSMENVFNYVDNNYDDSDDDTTLHNLSNGGTEESSDDENNINDTIKIKSTTNNLKSNEIKEETIAS